MSEEEKRKEDSSTISRREFLKDAGLMFGGATIGSISVLGACSSGSGTNTVTVTKTIASTTVTSPIITNVSQTATAGDLELTVNKRKYSLTGIAPSFTLAYVLREKCLLPGTKIGCNRGECGTCTVIMGGRTVYSCLVLAVEAAGKDILTVESLATNGQVNKLQQSFIKNRGFQCCYCTPGFLMSATALLQKKPKPTMAEVQEAVSGNLCPCGNMTRNVKSIMEGGS
jgi:carbon-monoxide dehydrogenase small subunit